MEEKNRVKLYGMTLVYNESTMIPYIMPYYEHMGYDKLVVYDNESTDNTVELLKKYPFVEVRSFSTGGLDDSKNKKLKEEFIASHLGEKDTWVTATDFDEVIFYDGDIKEYLYNKGKEGFGYLSQFMVQPYCKNFPSSDKFVHEIVEKGSFWKRSKHSYWESGGKTTMFNCESLKTVRFTAGCHRCTMKFENGGKKNIGNDVIKSFHIKYLDYDFMLKKMARCDEHRSAKNKQCRYGSEYEKLRKPEIFEKAWAELEEDSFLIKDYMDGKIIGDTTDRFITRI